MCGISVTSSLDAAGLFSSLRRKPRCGVRNADALGNKSKWGKEKLKYYILGRDHGDLPRQVWDEEFRLAFDAWSEITPLVFEQGVRQRRADISNIGWETIERELWRSRRGVSLGRDAIEQPL